jgi:hypothetical protein
MAELRGVVGRVYWAYHVAAELHGFTIWRDKKTKVWSLTGTIVVGHAYFLSKDPLAFVMPVKGGEWRFPILAHRETGSTIHATIEPPIRRAWQFR